MNPNIFFLSNDHCNKRRSDGDTIQDKNTVEKKKFKQLSYQSWSCSVLARGKFKDLSTLSVLEIMDSLQVHEKMMNMFEQSLE